MMSAWRDKLVSVSLTEHITKILRTKQEACEGADYAALKLPAMLR
jgi:hypothetical protein